MRGWSIRCWGLALGLGLVVPGAASAQWIMELLPYIDQEGLGGWDGEYSITVVSHSFEGSMVPDPGARSLTVVKRADATTPALSEAHRKGTRFREAKLTGAMGGESKEYMTITMKDVHITSYQTRGDSESLTLNFSKVEYHPKEPAAIVPEVADEVVVGFEHDDDQGEAPGHRLAHVVQQRGLEDDARENDGYGRGIDIAAVDGQPVSPAGAPATPKELPVMATLVESVIQLPGMPAEKVVVRGWDPKRVRNANLESLEIEVAPGALQDELMQAHKTGRTLELTLKALDGAKYLQWELKPVRVTSYSVSGAADAGPGTKSFQIISAGLDP